MLLENLQFDLLHFVLLSRAMPVHGPCRVACLISAGRLSPADGPRWPVSAYLCASQYFSEYSTTESGFFPVVFLATAACASPIDVCLLIALPVILLRTMCVYVFFILISFPVCAGPGSMPLILWCALHHHHTISIRTISARVNIFLLFFTLFFILFLPGFWHAICGRASLSA